MRSHSLVLVDELGKGTEVHAGTALAAAMLEKLAASGCAGVFATHLHMLLPGRLCLDAPGLVFAKMGVEEEEYEGKLLVDHSRRKAEVEAAYLSVKLH